MFCFDVLHGRIVWRLISPETLCGRSHGICRGMMLLVDGISSMLTFGDKCPSYAHITKSRSRIYGEVVVFSFDISVRQLRRGTVEYHFQDRSRLTALGRGLLLTTANPATRRIENFVNTGREHNNSSKCGSQSVVQYRSLGTREDTKVQIPGSGGSPTKDEGVVCGGQGPLTGSHLASHPAISLPLGPSILTAYASAQWRRQTQDHACTECSTAMKYRFQHQYG